MALVHAHLIACCAAIGLILMSDIAMVTQLISGDPHERMDPKHLQDRQNTVALAALWATGAGIIALDASVKGWEYFANPKLQAKITVVALLTLNGILLHHRVLPLMKKAGTLLNMSFSLRSFAVFAGSVSAVSWFYAAMLGVGRPLNWKYPLSQILAAYPVLIAGGFAALMLMVAWARYRTSGESRSFEGTRFVGAH
ncbi:hypothetical protein [Hydrogenophaga sp.]|uniref:hypothetical protein n=1 Tax=Hydrogenophaga sp. TaxID=1904254 RepID=UPI0027355435|nr:hypothetical protein [Hydrogenophaga sp.]MDP3886593.1 hypothetical protein [Hydrogenophaga sp.]